MSHIIVFGVVGFHWYLHNLIFHYFKFADRKLFGVNILHSALIALFPFTVKYTFQHEFGLDILFPIITWVMIALSELLLWSILKGWVTDKGLQYIKNGMFVGIASSFSLWTYLLDNK